MQGAASEYTTIPTIGIATWGVLHERSVLDKERETDPTTSKTMLDDNHNLFFLIDDDSDGQFGREIEWRSEFEKAVKQRRYYNAGSKTGPCPFFTQFSSFLSLFGLLVHSDRSCYRPRGVPPRRCDLPSSPRWLEALK